jgi:hypothetical protein
VSIGGLLLALLLTTVALVWIGLPLLRRAPSESAADVLAQKQRERLLVYYERVMTNIRDLDEDHATGKLADTDYRSERELWVERGVQVLKALDGETSVQPAPTAPEDAAVDAAIDEAIEAAIAAYRTA